MAKAMGCLCGCGRVFVVLLRRALVYLSEGSIKKVSIVLSQSCKGKDIIL